MSISPTYADLGGGIGSTTQGKRSARISRTISPVPGRVCARHMFDPVSGWCGCGTRDDGALAEGSPAWRAALERTMPEAKS
ncbi:hypothetical protein M2317_001320 [Microbacterium sp. ZKA21]|uniref:hypothetical protein n=1 Tax=Microbacterium sp. ZKA21 TaxID=3381694 RepID=UPI003D2016D9